jgi:hypothetical protein
MWARSTSAAALWLALLVGGCTAPNPAYFAPVATGQAADGAGPVELADARFDARVKSLISPDAASIEDPSLFDPPTPRDAAPSPDLAPRLDAAVDRGPPGAALLIVGDTSLSRSDAQLRTSLSRLGFTVTVKSDGSCTTADAGGKALVVVSGSTWPDDIGTKFRDVPVPVLIFDEALFGRMRMTGTRDGVDFGIASSARRLTMFDPGHPLAAGLSGTVDIASANIAISWGIPAGGAARIATLPGDSNRYTIFGFEAGAPMASDAVAPARRIGSFVRFARDTPFSNAGVLLFESSVLWAIGAN